MPMKRRDFLTFKGGREIRTVEFSCQQLHMHSLESRATAGQLDTPGQSDTAGQSETPGRLDTPGQFDGGGPFGIGRPLDEDFDAAEEGEPPTAFAERTTEQIFAKLERDLEDAEILRVTGHRWLSEGDEELQREFNELLSAFRAHGGRVEFG
jgi:hypothetical protein